MKNIKPGRSLFRVLENLPKGFLLQVGALFMSLISVHLFYLVYIRPAAESALAKAAAQGIGSAPRNIAIILKDFEQEICLMLMCWAIFLIGQKI